MRYLLQIILIYGIGVQYCIQYYFFFFSRETILEALHHYVRQKYPQYIGRDKPSVTDTSHAEDDIGKCDCY